MVKGISRQVIVVHAPDPNLFEQAIFILKENAIGDGISEEALLKEAQQVIRGAGIPKRKGYACIFGGLCAAFGAAIVGGIWLIAALL